MAIGDITGVIASFEWDTVEGHSPVIIHIAGNIYAIAYNGPDDDGWLKTVSISDNGSTLSTVKLLEFDPEYGYYPDIIHVADNIYAIAYVGPGDDGWLKTVSISDNGSTLSNKRSLEWDTVQGYDPDIIHITGNIYAIAYRGPGDDGWLKTVSISDDGGTLSTVKSLEWDTVDGWQPDIIHVAGNIYAIAYNGPGDHGWLKTVSISDDGGTLSTVALLEFDPGAGSGYYPDIIHIASNIYAIAYVMSPWGQPGGLLKTVSISDDGLTLINKASLEFDTVQALVPDIIHIAGNIYAIAYSGSDFVKTVSISDDGLTLSTVASLEGSGYDPHIVHIAGNTYAIAYCGPGDDGWLKTVGIITSEAASRTRFTGGVAGLQHRAVH